MSAPEPPVYGGIPQWPFSPPDAIAWGWQKFRQFLGPVFVGVAIYVAFSAITGLVAGGVSAAFTLAGESSPNAYAFEVTDTVIQALLQLLSTLGGMILSGAAARAALDVADGRQYDFINALQRIPIWKVIGSQLLIGAAVVIGLGVLVMLGVLAGVFLHVPVWILAILGIFFVAIPGLAVATFTYFTRWVLVDLPMTGIAAAIGESIRLVRANLGNAVLLLLLNLLVLVGGFLACCVGLVVAYPVTYFATANAYRRFRGQMVAA